MSKNKFSWKLFQQAPIVGIARNISLDAMKHILPLYRAAGLTNVEITMNTPGAVEILRYALENEAEGLNIGVGTVCTKKELMRALDAGAQFVVTPILNKKVINICVEKGVPIMPGAYTPTEIYKAWSLGANVVKVFPATALGPSFIKDLKGPMSQIKLLPTGGVSLDNMQEFLKAGAAGLGIGGQLFDQKLIDAENWDGLQVHFGKFVSRLV